MNFYQRWQTVLRPQGVGEKARRANTLPRPYRGDVGNESWEDFWAKKDEEEKQRIMLTVSWVYSAVDLIARESAAIPFRIKDIKKNEKEVDVPNHDFEQLLRSPNPFMTKTFLLRYLVYWLEMSRVGAFWYLAPDRQTGQLSEIWPLDSNQVTVVPSKTQFVDHYLYKPRHNSERAYKINPKYVAWFRYPDPFDYWASRPPFIAAYLPASIELGIQNSQLKFYSETRGIPLSLVSLDPELSDPDFETARADIKADWSEGATIAISRAGDIDVKSLGFTQKDLETLGNQELTRDKIDSIFFGYPIRSDNAFDGDGIKEADRLVKEKTIFPLLTLISEEITKSIIHPYYDDGKIGQFDDVRTADRALNIQEQSLTSRWQTMDEMRAHDGIAPMSDEQFPDIGSLPVWLATNPSFVGTYYGLNNRVDGGNIEAPPEVGNLQDSAAPEATVNRLVDSEAEKMACLIDLKRWNRVAKKALANGERKVFVSGVIPNELTDTIEKGLAFCKTAADIDELFKKHRARVQEVEV